MAVTHEAGLSPQAPPQAQDPCGGDQATWSQSPRVPHGSQEERGSPAAPSGTETGCSRTSVKTDKISENTVTEKLNANKKTDDMTNYMDDLTLSSPKERDSRSKSKTGRGRSSSRSSSRSSYSSRSSSSTSTSSRSWSRSRSRSRSRVRRNGSRRYRRYSRSYSRSRSRSHSRRYRERYHPRIYRRYRRSPPRYRSCSRSRSRGRSWSHGRPYYRRSYSRSRSRSRVRRYYGFGRTVYPEAYRSWRSRSRTKSRSRTPLRLSEKDKRELLEIAKANAAKAMGTDNVVLPASLRICLPSKETNGGEWRSKDSAESAEQSRRVTEDLPKSGTERAPTTKGIAFSPNSTVAKPVLQKPANLSVKETVSPVKEDDTKRNPYGQWVPIKKEQNGLFFNFSPKSTPFRAR